MRRLQGFKGGFYNVSFAGTQALLAKLGRDARGVANCQGMPLPFSAKAPVSAGYLAAGKSRGKKFEPNYGGIEGYIAARTLAAGQQQAGSNATPESLVTALENMPELNLGGFFINFSDKAHAGRLEVRGHDHPHRRGRRAPLRGVRILPTPGRAKTAGNPPGGWHRYVGAGCPHRSPHPPQPMRVADSAIPSNHRS